MRLMSCILISSLCIPQIAQASEPETEEIVTTLQIGEIAPFTGTLLNPPAAARILANAEAADIKCGALVTKEVGLTRAKMQYEIDVLQARFDSCAFLSDSRLELLRNQNEFLLDEMKRYQKPHHVWWFAGGTVLGSVIVLGVAHAMSPAM
jgi:hypothetical protein